MSGSSKKPYDASAPQRRPDRSDNARVLSRPTVATAARPLLQQRTAQPGSRTHIQSPLAQQPSNNSPSPPASQNDAPAAPRRASASKRSSISALPAANTGIVRANVPQLRSSPGVSPLQRDAPAAGTISPSLALAFESPGSAGLPAALSTSNSTASTDSVRTVKGNNALASSPSLASAAPVRTPSYPFPYVMPGGLNRRYSGPMHQSFLALSPTVQNLEGSPEQPGQRDRYHSISSTPGGSVTHFQPSGAATPADVDHFPAPNLYELVLELNAEPALEDWWTSVANIMHNWYTVDRATLSLPADPTDIENVPWGLKAVYNTTGVRSCPDSSNSNRRSSSLDSGTSRVSSKRGSLGAKAERPATGTATTSPTSQRPSNEFRPLSHQHEPDVSRSSNKTAGLASGTRPESLEQASTSGNFYQIRNPSSVGEFTISEAHHEESTSTVFPTLQPLDFETEPILDTTSVNRILERNKPVILTREYTNPPSSESSSNTPQPDQRFGRAPTPFDGSGGRMETLYEEYEQHAVSPWSQSPAPSPAIQADPSENPFFASGPVAGSFSPGSPTKEDYSEYGGAVEAIGIERAATIIHLPLVHPLHSWKLGALHEEESDEAGKPRRRRSRKRDASEGAADGQAAERRAPVAILSIYSRTVPFPQNLQHSLRHFCPHMATSLHTSLQMHSMQQQMAVRHAGTTRAWERFGGGVTGLGLGLDNIASLSSTLGSITSPSEWSGRSSSSALGTPGGLEQGNSLAAPGRHSRAATPGTAPIVEPTDNYFDAKKRVPITRSQSTNVVPLSHGKSPSKSSIERMQDSGRRGRDTRQGRRTTTDTRDRSSEVPRTSSGKGEEAQEASSEAARQAENTKRRSLLHSYGADFQASFGSLPAASGLQQPEISTVEGQWSSDMPPPSERLMRTIVDALPVQIFTAQPQTGALTWANTKFLVYRNHNAKQVMQDPWAAIDDKDYAEYAEGWKRSLESGHQFQRKVRLKRFDGVFRWFYVRAAPLRDRTQNIVHWVGTYVDVHEQHIAESNSARQQETAASESKYRALANSSPQIVFAATRSRGIVFCNTQWIDYSGQAEEQALGVGFLEHVHPDDVIKCKLPTFDAKNDDEPNVPVSVPSHPRRTASGLSSSLSSMGPLSPGSEGRTASEDSGDTTITLTGYNPASPSEMPQRKLSELASRGILKITRDSTGKPSYSTEVRLRSRLGEYRWHLVRVLLAEASVSEDNQEETWYGSCADINDHKELESQLKETMDAKSRFLSNMSHEIRTPLNGIHGMANFLIDSKLSDDQMDQVNVIRTSAEGLRDLINDILDLSKVEAGMITLEKKWLHLRSIIEEVNDLAAPLALEKGIELNYLVDDSVPTIVKGDRFRIRQVLLNVIGNAIKFTQQGEVLVKCARIEAPQLATDSVLVQFEVHDTGKGFTEKEAERLFKRFSQIDGSSTRQHGGSGLGLVISMQLVELHGGAMYAKSNPGQGSTFFFSLELGMPTEADPVSKDVKDVLLPADGRSSPLVGDVPNLVDEMAVTPTVDKDLQIGLPSPRIALPESPVSPMKSSGSSDPSVQSALASSRSARSSQSSVLGPAASSVLKSGMVESPPVLKPADAVVAPGTLDTAHGHAHGLSGARMRPLLYSVLVVATLPWTREATWRHLGNVLPKNVPHHVTVMQKMEETRSLLLESKESNIIFTHVVINVPAMDDITELVRLVLHSPMLSQTSIVIITSPVQRKDILLATPSIDYEQLVRDGRLHFVFKPLKAAKLSPIFDPDKSRKRSTDHNQHSAQQVAESQKQVFDEMTRRIGNKNYRVLIVEDNMVNQKVLTKLLKRVSLASETAADGVECLDKFLSRPAGYFSIILCDLHMPNKDGYQTCAEIRAWERNEAQEGRAVPRVPIVALSANVLGDVQADCAKAGFDSFLTKPVEFKDFSKVVTKLLEPERSTKE